MSHMRHDSSWHESRHAYGESWPPCTCAMTRHMCDMTHTMTSYVWHDACHDLHICVPWLIYMCCWMPKGARIEGTAYSHVWLFHKCAMPSSYVRHDPPLYASLLTSMYVRRVGLTCVPWLPTYRSERHPAVSKSTPTEALQTLTYDSFLNMPWPPYTMTHTLSICASIMTHSYVKRLSYTEQAPGTTIMFFLTPVPPLCLICITNSALQYTYHDSRICAILLRVRYYSRQILTEDSFLNMPWPAYTMHDSLICASWTVHISKSLTHICVVTHWLCVMTPLPWPPYTADCR